MDLYKIFTVVEKLGFDYPYRGGGQKVRRLMDLYIEFTIVDKLGF